MSNQSLRERFKLPETKAATASLLIEATKDVGLVKADAPADMHKKAGFLYT